MREIKVAVVGIGGYGDNYIQTMKKPQREGVTLVGAVDPFVKECPLCPVYDTMDELFAHHQPDLAVISTPIHLHAEQAECAFRHGCHVLLEKPIAPTMEGVRRILKARDDAGKLLGVGFQLCADPALRAVKADADAGLFGAAKRLRAIVLYPRDRSYYARHADWGGKRRNGAGYEVYDNVLSNATAHYLENMLWMLGTPLRDLDFLTLRANDIETFDTAIVKGKAGEDAQALIAVSHAVGRAWEQRHMFRYEFEQATVCFNEVGQPGGHVVARFRDGTVKDYGQEGTGWMAPYWNMVDVLRGEAPIACTGETALLHVDALERMRAMQPDATPFPAGWVREDEGMLWVPGLAQELYRAFDTGELPRFDFTAESCEVLA